MPRQSNGFQRIVAAIHACLAENVIVEESALLTDRETGEKREVDIVLRSKIGDYEVVLSIEVRDRSRLDGSGWIEEMAGKHQALETNRLVLVSKSGFTKPAIKKAKARNIETITLEEACSIDWDLAFDLEGQGVFQLFNITSNCLAHIAGMSEWYAPHLSDMIILPSGKCSSVGNIVSSVLFNPIAKKHILDHFDLTKEEDYHAVYDLPSGALLENNHKEQSSIIKLWIGLHLVFEATPIEFASGRFRGRDIVYGQAISPNSNLCIVMRRKESGEIEGTLYDSNGFRRLVADKSINS